jgi:hypothetical protein
VRFIFAVFALIVGVALIGAGIAQRTVLLPPNTVTASTKLSDAQPYVMIDSGVLKAHDGSQTLVLSGSDSVFAAYGRTDDVKAWLNGSSYDTLGYDSKSNELTSSTVAADPSGSDNVKSGSANPAGSDLWLEQYTSADAMYRTLNLPAGYSVIIASDGTKPAPTQIQVSWPIGNATPWAGPLVAAGIVFLLAGLVLLVLGLLHNRRSRRPRRKPPALPKGKRFSPSRTNAIESGVKRGRRSIGAPMLAAPIAILAVIGLAGCTSDYADWWPQAATSQTEAPTGSGAPTPIPTASGVPAQDKAPMPAITQAQAEAIVANVSSVAAQADAASDKNALASRFTGPALDLRTATYAIRAGYPEYPAPQAVPSGPLQVVLPQSTDAWPRTALAIVQGSDATVPPVALMLVQNSPRENYKVYYQITLEPNTSLPPVAAASVGAPSVASDTKLLTMTPDQLKTAYADILAVGDQSQYINQVDATGDTLRTQVGVDYKNAQKAALPSTASMDFGKIAAPGENLTLATNDSGALVAVNLRESQTVKPTEDGATVSPQGAVLALSGVSTTSKGTEADYDYQLLFYIPPYGDAGKAKLLGFTQGLISAKELP